MGRFFRVTKNGVSLFIHLTPNASKDEFTGLFDFQDKNCLKVRVRAVPEKGKANVALCALVAKSLGLPKSRIEVISGHTSRLKTLLVRGDVDEIKEKLKVFENG